VKPDPKKIELIKEWQSLVLAKGVRSFLGLVNFYRKFIKDFSALAKLLIDLLKKEGLFKWKCKQQKMFDLLKEKSLLTLKLQFMNFMKLFKVHTDANAFVIGRVFMQEGHSIAFKSKKLAGV
jgi:hypothetical protein